jgi:hypothetical protein
MYLVVTNRKGVSSLELSKVIGVTQKSAWFLLRRLREACQGDEIILSGVVEADETYIVGKERNKRAKKKTRAGPGSVAKTAVLGMREIKRDGKAVFLSGTDTTTTQGREINIAP